MVLTVRDKSLIMLSMTFYLKHLEKYAEDELGADEFSEIQDEIVYLEKLLHEFEANLEDMKSNAAGLAKLYDINDASKS